MIAAVDVLYKDNSATAACVTFQNWTDAAPVADFISHINQVEDYIPGQFYRRELPCILAVLATLPTAPETIIVDGYVWLAPERPGLGHHLYEALPGRIPIIGVAKTQFAGSTPVEVLRGAATRPLYVTAIGIDPAKAADHIRSMYGPHRMPTLLKRVDTLTRTSQ